MINEIARFVETIPDKYHTEGLNPDQGLHIIIELDKNGKLNTETYESYIISKKIDREPVWDYIAEMEYYSKCIDSNKYLDVGGKGKMKIHSATPYALWFRKNNIDDIPNRIPYYFNSIYEMKNNIDDSEKKCIEIIEQFCRKELIQLVKKNPKIGIIKDSDYVKVYFRVDKKYILKSYHRYLDNHLFLKDAFNIKLDDGRVIGMTSFLTGDNEKKVFLRHQTTPYVINERADQKMLRQLYQFEKLLLSEPKKLPNPLPIFEDSKELNSEVVRLYRSNPDRPLKFNEIIHQLFEQKKEDLSKYYLMNWRKTIVSNKLTAIINDFDFVPQFRYKLSGFEIKNLMGIKDYQERKIDNIFQFEFDVVRTIFNNALIIKTKNDEILLKYFDDIDPKYMSAITYQNIIKYRKSFYDYIYKSRTQAITGKMFYDLIISAVVDDIKRDEEYKKTYTINEKLNILFSLNHIFDTNNNNFKGVNMASKIPEYQERMRKLFNDDNYHITEDDEFAFAAGQLIYYILKQSKSSNKSHALLEPFITKNDPEQFRQMIVRGIDQYKHAFEWYGSGKGRFEKLAGEIMGYDCKTNIKEMLPIVLAGYFSQSLIYESSNNNQTKE